jgi:hypothetical protein
VRWGGTRTFSTCRSRAPDEHNPSPTRRPSKTRTKRPVRRSSEPVGRPVGRPAKARFPVEVVVCVHAMHACILGLAPRLLASTVAVHCSSRTFSFGLIAHQLPLGFVLREG